MRLPKFTTLAAFVGAFSLSTASAQTQLVDFDSFPGMSNSPNALVPAASRLSTQLATTSGVTFSSTGGFVAVVNHAPNLTTSMPNIIGGTLVGAQLNYLQMITVAFVDPANPSAPATTDFVQVRGDKVALPGTATMKVYSSAGVLLASQSVPDVAGGLTLAIAMPGIQRVELTQTSGTIGFDDLSFDQVVPCAQPVSYCTAGTTTHGCLATMSAGGTASAGAPNGFVLSATSLEGQKQGLFFYGLSGPTATPWGVGTSFLCVKAPTQRMPAANSGGTSGGCNGSLSIDWNAFRATSPTALGTPFSGGQTVHAQCWFRDPSAPKTTNLSDGLRFSVCP